MDDVEVVAQREVLVDDLDPQRVRVLRPVDRHGLALEDHVAVVERVDAGDALDQRALAGTVVADQRGHLSGTNIKVHVPEDVDRAEALIDAAQGQQRIALLSLDGLGHVS